MHKQIIINALKKELDTYEYYLQYDIALARSIWNHCDKSKPVSTELYYNEYKRVRNRIRSLKKKLTKIREAIRQVKCL